jgi:PTS system nitrogen regulatory IIA component
MQLALREVAAILGVPEGAVYRWIAERELPARQVNGQYRFDGAQLLEWAALHHVAVAPRAFGRLADERAALYRFDAALEAGGVRYDVRGDGPAGVVREVVAALPLPEGFDRDGLAALIGARGLRATALGGGVAVPHPRRPIVVPGRPPSVTLCFLAAPVPAGDGGGEINTLFLVLSPTARAHLQVLARIAYASQDPTFRDLLKSRAPAAELMREAHRVEEEFLAHHAPTAP